ncbi:ImmA/IrrE family metallo-endopeptidase [Enterococcus nangangensis]|uniref:ImmA/IrrE family metallo-endopeptidase n=1 Tax=Enterococcus nangangensis TaxID=2559926 RepID=UPI0010F9AE03|nr:ImmA/IrrE family metallo-endopeptidase [Enterococcus nangangensis]
MKSDYTIAQLVKSLDVQLVYDMELQAPAFYSPDFNIIAVNTHLTEYDQKIAILHELGHACLHQQNSQLYRITATMREKMEFEANCFMIKKLLYPYLENPEIDLYSFNALQFLVRYQLNQNYLEITKKLYLDFMKLNHYPLFFNQK